VANETKLPDSWMIIAIYGDGDEPSTIPDDAFDNPLGKLIEQNQLKAALGKGAIDPEWDEPIGASPVTKSDDLTPTSDARFEKVTEKVRKIFGPDHADEAEEAIALARKIRDEARAEVLARA
jgi:hypothetical protein